MARQERYSELAHTDTPRKEPIRAYGHEPTAQTVASRVSDRAGLYSVVVEFSGYKLDVKGEEPGSSIPRVFVGAGAM
jgi:hypothetical protein